MTKTPNFVLFVLLRLKVFAACANFSYQKDPDIAALHPGYELAVRTAHPTKTFVLFVTSVVNSAFLLWLRLCRTGSFVVRYPLGFIC